MAFTALGSTVNVAHRLQELARHHDVAAAVSNDVYRIAGVAAEPREIETVLRGTSAPLRVRLVGGDWMPLQAQTA